MSAKLIKPKDKCKKNDFLATLPQENMYLCTDHDGYSIIFTQRAEM